MPPVREIWVWTSQQLNRKKLWISGTPYLFNVWYMQERDFTIDAWSVSWMLACSSVQAANECTLLYHSIWSCSMEHISCLNEDCTKKKQKTKKNKNIWTLFSSYYISVLLSIVSKSTEHSWKQKSGFSHNLQFWHSVKYCTAFIRRWTLGRCIIVNSSVIFLVMLGSVVFQTA